MNKEEAIKRIRDFGLYHAIEDLPHSTKTVEAFEMAIQALEEPERKHGKWICENEEDWFPSCRCSVCGCVENGCWVTVQDRKIVQYKVNFCPNCGADMREEIEDERSD